MSTGSRTFVSRPRTVTALVGYYIFVLTWGVMVRISDSQSRESRFEYSCAISELELFCLLQLTQLYK